MQTWTGVRKIRLRGLPHTHYQTHYSFQFVRQGEDGQEEIVSASRRFKIGIIKKNTLARKLTEDLHLRHAVVDGVDEYSVA